MKQLILIAVLSLTFQVWAEDEFFTAKSTLGGYGELHFNQTKPEDGNWSDGTLDFHRFVLFYGYAWSAVWSFKSEVELEHNFVKEGQGELELEQAYINYAHSPAFNFQSGVVLPSVGLINETHEPPMFFGVERPGYSKVIIPTTWFGNGVAASGIIDGMVDYKVVVMEGLNSAKFDAKNGLRGGRQKGFKAATNNILFNVRGDYTGMPGLRIGGSYSRNHLMTNESKDQLFESVNLIEFHLKYTAQNVMFVSELGNVAYNPLSETDVRVTNSFGYYLQAGYNVLAFLKKEAALYPFVHFTAYNPGAEVQNDSKADEVNQVSLWKVGLHFQPIREVVFKFDIGRQTKGADDDKTLQLNLGSGYHF